MLTHQIWIKKSVKSVAGVNFHLTIRQMLRPQLLVTEFIDVIIKIQIHKMENTFYQWNANEINKYLTKLNKLMSMEKDHPNYNGQKIDADISRKQIPKDSGIDEVKERKSILNYKLDEFIKEIKNTQNISQNLHIQHEWLESPLRFLGFKICSEINHDFLIKSPTKNITVGKLYFTSEINHSVSKESAEKIYNFLIRQKQKVENHVSDFLDFENFLNEFNLELEGIINEETITQS